MTPYGIQIVHSMLWRGKQEEFATVWHFNVAATFPSDSGWNDLIDKVVAEEKPLYKPGVSFLRGRVWGPTYDYWDATPENKNASQMRFIKDLTGAGTLVGGAAMPNEFAVMTSLYVGRGPKGGKQILRKFFHSGYLPAGVDGSAYLRGETAIPAASKTPYVTAVGNLRNVTLASFANQLCTPGGKIPPSGELVTVNDYLRVRQFTQH